MIWTKPIRNCLSNNVYLLHLILITWYSIYDMIIMIYYRYICNYLGSNFLKWTILNRFCIAKSPTLLCSIKFVVRKCMLAIVSYIFMYMLNVHVRWLSRSINVYYINFSMKSNWRLSALKFKCCVNFYVNFLHLSEW